MTMSLDRKQRDRVPGQISLKNVFHRKEQLDNWKDSPTAKESAVFKLIPQVRFGTSTSFLAACAVGDIEDAEQLLKKGADINSTNIDKMTALHQACIDCNLNVIEFLLDNGCNVNVQDVEGWTPLHAAASCALPDVVSLLLQWGADPGVTNNDNDLAQDLAEDEETSELLCRAAELQGLDLDSARDLERELMLTDAARWRREGYPVDQPLDEFRATPLHVAAAKGYLDVLQELLACRGVNVEAKDVDGWTALHAAAHWGQKEAARILCEAGGHIDTASADGLTPCDVADPEHLPYMRQLKEKYGVRLRKDLGKQFEIRHAVGRRSSVIRISTDQKNLMTRNQKEPSPMVMMFGNVLLKKTLMGLRDNLDMPNPRAQARVAEHRHKVLSMMETPEEHAASPCCLHRRSTPVALDEGKENDARLSLINEDVERRQSGGQDAVFGEARRPRRSGRDSVRSEGSRGSVASRVTLPSSSSASSRLSSASDVSRSCQAASERAGAATEDFSASVETQTTAAVSETPAVETQRASLAVSESSRVSAVSEISRTSLASKSSQGSEAAETKIAPVETERPSTTAAPVETQREGEDAEMGCVSTPSHGEETGRPEEVSAAEETQPRAGLVQRAISRWSEKTEDGSAGPPRPWVPLRRANIVSDAGPAQERSRVGRDDSPRRKISSVLTPHKFHVSETQRMAKSRSALSDRRSTQGEVFDPTDVLDDPFDEPVQQPQDDFKALYEAAQREAEALRDQLAQLSMEHEVQAKAQERQRQIEQLERENADLRHEKALDDLRAENHRLKEENASLVRVISKMSLRTADPL